ncbi:PIN domain-containing protein [candidate division KSB1 bacterium]|nr:PIN domain-containing protein [candidate division KSB1 bacterium]
MKTYPISNSGSRALLIDLDNCLKQIDLLHQALAGITRAVACYGSVEPKVQVGLVPLLAAAINEGKLEIVKMDKKGKNAANFGLAFWAGRLAAEMPPETEFIILSQDSDLDHLVSLFRSVGLYAGSSIMFARAG